MAHAYLTIGEMADLLGITTKAIRHYHQIGLIEEPPRSEGGYRVYGGRDLDRLQAILRLQKFGLSLRQISFVLESKSPDTLLRQILAQRQDVLTEEIETLQKQQTVIRDFLERAPKTPIPYSSCAIVQATIKPVASNLADLFVVLEGDALRQIDGLRWSAGYEPYWQRAATALTTHVLSHEHQFMLWTTRYLALESMQADDRQAQAWLNELRGSSARGILRGAFRLPALDDLPPDERGQIERLLQLLMVEQASPVQKQFLALMFR